MPGLCGNGTCSNVHGGFECECDPGYTPGVTGNLLTFKEDGNVFIH